MGEDIGGAVVELGRGPQRRGGEPLGPCERGPVTAPACEHRTAGRVHQLLVGGVGGDVEGHLALDRTRAIRHRRLVALRVGELRPVLIMQEHVHLRCEVLEGGVVGVLRERLVRDEAGPVPQSVVRGLRQHLEPVAVPFGVDLADRMVGMGAAAEAEVRRTEVVLLVDADRGDLPPERHHRLVAPVGVVLLELPRPDQRTGAVGQPGPVVIRRRGADHTGEQERPARHHDGQSPDPRDQRGHGTTRLPSRWTLQRRGERRPSPLARC